MKMWKIFQRPPDTRYAGILHFPVSEAIYCVDCRHVSNAKNGHCPVCEGHCIQSLSSLLWLDLEEEVGIKRTDATAPYGRYGEVLTKGDPYVVRGYFQMRLFGYGIIIVNHKRNKPLFSDRHHLIRRWHIGNFCIRPTTPAGVMKREIR